jgi:hypothetical protein
VLRAGEGSATFGQAERFVQDPSEIPRQPEELRKQGAVRRMVSYPIFGQEVELGLADYELPPVRVVRIVPYANTPDAPARVVLEAGATGRCASGWWTGRRRRSSALEGSYCVRVGSLDGGDRTGCGCRTNIRCGQVASKTAP